MLHKPILPLLLLSLGLLCLAACTGPALPTPLPPTAPAPPEPTPADISPPETVITTTLDGTISRNYVTFTWTGTDGATPTAGLAYSFYLQGHEADYSPFASTTAKTYTGLPDGSYTFYVKSRDSAGNIDPTPAAVSFTVAAAPQQDGIIVPIDTPLLIAPGSNVNRIAVGAYANIVYALDSINAQLYKSEQGGFGWANISRNIGGAPSWKELALAPDNPLMIAVVTDGGREVYMSDDGGASFGDTGLSSKLSASERVECLSISPVYGRIQWELAVGTSTGNGGGRVLLFLVAGLGGGWQDLSTGMSGWLPAPAITGVDVFAIEYSPTFLEDGTLLAIVSSSPAGTDDTYLYLGSRDLGADKTTWNQYPGYPVEICQSGQDTPGTPLTYADLAVPADYSGAVPFRRHVYACWSDNPPGVTTAGNPNDDVYRLDDTVCYKLNIQSDVICTLAHYGIYGRGKLLAGAATARPAPFNPGVQTYFSANPQSAYPVWQSSQKPPTGPNEAQVAWATNGAVAYCGTSSITGGGHDQSAFSRSVNDGFTWNQIGLIDL